MTIFREHLAWFRVYVQQVVFRLGIMEKVFLTIAFPGL